MKLIKLSLGSLYHNSYNQYASMINIEPCLVGSANIISTASYHMIDNLASQDVEGILQDRLEEVSLTFENLTIHSLNLKYFWGGCWGS